VRTVPTCKKEKFAVVLGFVDTVLLPVVTVLLEVLSGGCGIIFLLCDTLKKEVWLPSDLFTSQLS
jgi:hypothetical protein